MENIEESKSNSDKMWKIWNKAKMNSEKTGTIWKKCRMNCEMIWKI